MEGVVSEATVEILGLNVNSVSASVASSRKDQARTVNQRVARIPDGGRIAAGADGRVEGAQSPDSANIAPNEFTVLVHYSKKVPAQCHFSCGSQENN